MRNATHLPRGVGTTELNHRTVAVWLLWLLACLGWWHGAHAGQRLKSTWPQPYSVRRPTAAGLLVLSNAYYSVEQRRSAGGAISRIRLTYGRATNLLAGPVATRVVDEQGTVFTDLGDTTAKVSHQTKGLKEIVTVEARLLDEQGRASGLRVKTILEYHWGYIKLHRELLAQTNSMRVKEVCPFAVVLAPGLTDYGYREGTTEDEGAGAFSFGSNRWGKLEGKDAADPLLRTRYVPRSLIFANAGVEGLEWFVGSDLSQWELQFSGRRGHSQCLLRRQSQPAGLALTLSPFWSAEAAIPLPEVSVFDCYLGLPILEGHALRPWFHASFNRNRGEWVPTEQVRRWQESGIQTVHCHNDGDYYDDGLFWRDGSYPPYPDMDQYDQVIKHCQQAGIQVATYFSNKELHPSTQEFKDHGTEWGRKDKQGKLQHNFFRGQSEFGVQMCLRSGWLDSLKFMIDRVLKNHPLNGVYYDWNVALYCANPLHEGRQDRAAGHWDMDQLLDLMEWTRQRVGPEGLIIVHNTTTPMFVTENLADFVVANEWGYQKWTNRAPRLEDLPLEWSLVNARPRGVISYGQLDGQAPRRLHRLFALEALLSGVTPWPASAEAFEVFSLLKPLGQIETFRFGDWRDSAITLEGQRCASAFYSRPKECYLVLANLDPTPQTVRCALRPARLPYPFAAKATAKVLPIGAGEVTSLDLGKLTGEGAIVSIPGDSAVLVQIR